MKREIVLVVAVAAALTSGCGAGGGDQAKTSPAVDGGAPTSSDAGSKGPIDAAIGEASSSDDAAIDGATPPQDGGDVEGGDRSTDAGVATGIHISGHSLQRDGKPWMPKGLSMIGALTAGSAITAYSHWGAPELMAAKSFGADAMRLQVSQPVLDPQSTSYSASYLAQVEAMVSLAESYGFAVILSMQDQSLAGGNADPLPTASTQRAWAALAPAFATDGEVIDELYNEPQNTADAAGWAEWQNGGTGTVGHQQLLDGVRMLGAKNVVLADGAQHAEVLTGVPALNDSLANFGYAAHPYYLDAIDTDPSAWDTRFGDLASSFVVVVTEWDEYSTSSSCEADAPTLAPMFVTYVAQHDIGIFGWAFDLPGTLVQDWNWTPTTYTNFTCGTAGGGAGALLHSAYTMP
jgi:hypothetical protein